LLIVTICNSKLGASCSFDCGIYNHTITNKQIVCGRNATIESELQCTRLGLHKTNTSWEIVVWRID